MEGSAHERTKGRKERERGGKGKERGRRGKVHAADAHSAQCREGGGRTAEPLNALVGRLLGWRASE